MNEPAFTRRYIREFLALKPHREMTEREIFSAVDRVSRDRLEVVELENALAWNREHGLVEGRLDAELERSVFKLTPKGLQKEKIA